MKKTNLTTFIIIVVVFILFVYCFAKGSAQHSSYSTSSQYFSSKTSSGYYPTATPKPTPRQTPRPTEKPAPRATTSPETGRRVVTPSLSTDGFYHAEDFYDWYKDDFSDYEEAEDYYYSHGGW